MIMNAGNEKSLEPSFFPPQIVNLGYLACLRVNLL